MLAIVLISVAKKGRFRQSTSISSPRTPRTFRAAGRWHRERNRGDSDHRRDRGAISLPLGVLLAIFNTEFAPPRLADAIRLTLNVLAGVPTIVIGVFIFSLSWSAADRAASPARLGLSIVMLPLIARATEEVLLLVPSTLREGSMALGASRTRTVLTVILPTAIGGIVTATIVAVARAAGETAPLLFTSSIFATTVSIDPRQAMASMPMSIFVNSEQPSQSPAAAGLGRGARPDRPRTARGAWSAGCCPSERGGRSSRCDDRQFRLNTMKGL